MERLHLRQHKSETEAVKDVSEDRVTPGIGSSGKSEIVVQQECEIICGEDDRMDGGKSKVYQDDISAQRKEGLRYPQLRWPDKLCIGSQSL